MRLLISAYSAGGDCIAADFTIFCGDKEYKVHSLVFELHSPVLAKAANGVFKVTFTHFPK